MVTVQYVVYDVDISADIDNVCRFQAIIIILCIGKLYKNITLIIFFFSSLAGKNSVYTVHLYLSIYISV